MADHAADVIGLLDALDIRDPLLVGHSFGGMLALYLAAHFPERFPQIVVLDCGDGARDAGDPRTAEAGPRPPRPDLSVLGGVPGGGPSRCRSSRSRGTRRSRVTSGPISGRTSTAASSRGPGRMRSARRSRGC